MLLARPGTIFIAAIFVCLMVGAAGQDTSAAAPKRYFAPPAWILGPMQGRDADEKTFNDILNHLDQNGIPITAFHFDFDGWETCPNNAQFAWSDNVLNRMRTHNPPIRAVFWIVPLLKQGCAEFNTAATSGFLIRNPDGSPMITSSWQGKGGWIDFGNPKAVAYWHSLIDRIIARANGVIGGFYTDDVRPDLSNNTAYSDAYVRDLLDYTRSKIPDGDVIMKRYGANTPDDAFLSRYGHAAYVNDLPTDFGGLQEGVRRILSTSSVVPAPYNEFTGYADPAPDAETYIRRVQFGALQPIMENDNLPQSAFPWDGHYPASVIQAYRYYTTLHWELVPFFHTYDEISFLDGWSVFQRPDPAHFSTMLGRELFVQYVTHYGSSVDVSLPPGEWINYWNEQQTFVGPATVRVDAPPGREPLFIANGAIIPMQVRDGATGHGTTASSGSLTVNVFPKGHSTFSYYDDVKWLMFDVNQSGSGMTLCTTWAPSRPLIYRISRTDAPSRVSILNGAVGVNTTWGASLPGMPSEQAVDGSAGGWFYDSANRRLIIKTTQVGRGCPSSPRGDIQQILEDVLGSLVP